MRKLITIDKEKLFFCYLRSDTVTQFSIYWDGTNFFVNLFVVVFYIKRLGTRTKSCNSLENEGSWREREERRGGEGRDGEGGGEGM